MSHRFSKKIPAVGRNGAEAHLKRVKTSLLSGQNDASLEKTLVIQLKKRRAMNRYFAIASLVASCMFAGQSGTAEAGHGCRTTYYATPTYTVVQPTPTAVVVTAPAPAPATAIVKPKGILVPQGSQLRLKANFLGKEEGQVYLFVNTTSHLCQILEWQTNYVIVNLPGFAVSENTAGKILIATNDGSLKRKVDVIIAPTPDVEVVPTDEVPPMAPIELFDK